MMNGQARNGWRLEAQADRTLALPLLSAAAQKILRRRTLMLAGCLLLVFSIAQGQAFTHPGALHTQQDLDRMQAKVASGAQPWKASWERLTGNSHSSLTRAHTNPVPAVVYRGFNGTNPENYASLFRDAASAYATALRWQISGDVAYAEKSIAILNAWSAGLKAIDGTTDKFLAAGIYGYQLANAAEIMRTYSGWAPADFGRFQNLMLTVFYPMNKDFLVRHNNACVSHYWANWDLANMSAMLSIGILCDRRDIYNEAVEYFKNGAGNGSIKNMVPYLHGELGQFQESGRDQGHAMLCVALAGSFAEMAWNQGDDLYGYDDNRLLKGFEYIAKYNLGYEVPYTTYRNCSGVVQTVVSPDARGNVRPVWEMVYNHYVNRKGLAAPYTALFAQRVRPEGGGGHYGPNSGGYDQMGYGTLTYTLEETVKPNSQTISFPAIANKEFGAPDFHPVAVASSGLPIVYSSSDPSVASINTDGTIRVLKPGTTQIYAQQLGNDQYQAAPVAQQSLTVNRIPGTTDGTWSNTAGTLTTAIRSSSGSAELTWVSQTFVVGDHVKLTGTVPGGFAPNTLYTVVAASGPVFQLALQPGGTPIKATTTITNGTGQRFQKWGNPANWGGGVLPGGTNATATFGATSFANIPGVTLDDNITIGTLSYAANGSSELTLASGGNNGMLTFATVSGSPEIRMVNSGTRKLFLGNATNNTRIPLKIAGTQGLTINTPVYGGGNPAGLRIQAAIDWSHFSGGITLAQGTIELHNTTNSPTAADNLLLPPQRLTLGSENTAVLIFTGAGNVASKQTVGALDGTSDAYIFARTAITNGTATLVVGADNQDGNYEGTLGIGPVDAVGDKGRLHLEKVGSGTQVISGIIRNGTTGSNYSAVTVRDGKLVLSGANEYLGPTTVTGGTLEVNGVLTSPVAVATGTFGGAGSSSQPVVIGDAQGASDAWLSPMGTFTTTGPLTLQQDATLRVEYNNVSGAFDKIVAHGLTLADAQIQLTDLGPDTYLSAGTSFTLLDNTSEASIAGTFSHLPEGSLVEAGLNLFLLTYQGGTGNDLVLTVIKRTQEITFSAMPEMKVGDYDFAPATVTSGLPVTYASSDEAVATIVDGKIRLMGSGTVTITAIQAGDARFEAAAPVSQTLVVVQLAHTPYGGTARLVPGVVEAEDYDLGGEGVAYHDQTPVNQGHAYRQDDVDIEANTEGGYYVYKIKHQEWLKYTVRVLQSGAYHLDIRLAGATKQNTIRVEVDGTEVLPLTKVPDTGQGNGASWMNLRRTIQLQQGLRVVTVYLDGVQLQIDKITFTSLATPGTALRSAATEMETRNVPWLVLYPNPVQDKLHLRLGAGAATAAVAVYNTQGVVVLAKELTRQEQVLDLRAMPAGVYLVRVQQGSQVTTKKIFKR
jgi:autotransporter-associated beta strand protein